LWVDETASGPKAAAPFCLNPNKINISIIFQQELVTKQKFKFFKDYFRTLLVRPFLGHGNFFNRNKKTLKEYVNLLQTVCVGLASVEKVIQCLDQMFERILQTCFLILLDDLVFLKGPLNLYIFYFFQCQQQIDGLIS
jgi:hypothetical protein